MVLQLASGCRMPHRPSVTVFGSLRKRWRPDQPTQGKRWHRDQPLDSPWTSDKLVDEWKCFEQDSERLKWKMIVLSGLVVLALFLSLSESFVSSTCGEVGGNTNVFSFFLAAG
jgi:hypothetical protein